MKLLILTTRTRTMPSRRYRIDQHLPLLEQAGIHTQVVEADYGSLLRNLVYKFSFHRALAKSTHVLVQKMLLPPSLMRHIRNSRKATLYDFDDAVFLEPGTSNPSKHKVVFDQQLGFMDRIVAGNEFLGNYAKNYNKNTFVIPTGYEFPDTLPPRMSRQATCIGWIGTSVNFKYLDVFCERAQRAFDKFSDLSLLVMSDAPYEYTGIPIANQTWSAAGESNFMKEIDIGIMPLFPGDWEKGKCGFKLVQYIAHGVPVMATNIGVNASIIEDGVDGILIGKAENWSEKIEYLMKKPELLEFYSERAFNKNKKVFDRPVVFERLLSVIGEL